MLESKIYSVSNFKYFKGIEKQFENYLWDYIVIIYACPVKSLQTSISKNYGKREICQALEYF